MSKFIKENWFVALIAVFFLVISVYFAYDQNKGKLPGKTVGGKQVVFSVDDTNFTADDYYDELSKSYKEAELVKAFRNTLLDEAYKTTDDFKDEVKAQWQNTISYYETYYGYGQSYLDQIAQYYYGYDSFYDYVFYSLKADKVYSEYINAHLNELVTDEFIEKYQPRIVRYVVIAMGKPAEPTEDELKKLNDAKEAWASGEYSAANFADFAKKYSTDSGAQSGGLFGYLDKNTSGIDQTFLDTAFATKVGEVSDWTYSEKFGYYLIYVESTDVKDFKDESGLHDTLMTINENLANEILWAKAQELNVKFADDEIKDIIMKNLDLNKESKEEKE